jgi:hypothetical protein
VLPLGDATESASALCDAIEPKIAQYFMLCDAVRLDPRLAERAWPDPTGTDLLEPTAATALMLRAPLARARPDGLLVLTTDANPAYAVSLARLARDVVAPMLGTDGGTLDRAGWSAIRAKFAPYRAWQASKPEFASDRPLDVIRTHATDASLAQRARDLIAKTAAGAVALDGLILAEKLVLFQEGMLRFVNSFVSQPDLYHMDRRSMFEMGTLILDGRRLTLAVRVTDAARHEKFAADGAMFVLYALIGEKTGVWDYEVAVPVTAGERGNIAEGAWGVFVDLHGRERHALVRKVVSNPISIKEAMLSPLWRFGSTVQAMVDKAGAAQQARIDANAEGHAQSAIGATLAPAVAAPIASAPAPLPHVTPVTPPAAASGGGATQIATMAAGGGIALAAIGSLIAYVSELFWRSVTSLASGISDLLTPWIVAPVELTAGMTNVATSAARTEWIATIVQTCALPVAILLVLAGFLVVPTLAYAIPVAISAWLKLRRRDLAALL